MASLWGVYKIVKEVKKPSEDLKSTVEEHGQCIEDDHSRLKALEESNKMILQCLLVIINHDITNLKSEIQIPSVFMFCNP